MGCPPDPIDVSIGRGNNESSELKEKAERLIPQAKTAARFLVELGKEYENVLSKDHLNNANALYNDAQRYSASHLGQTFGHHDFGEGSGQYGYPDMSVLYQHLSESEKYVKMIEINLCITRDLILKAIDLIGENNLSEKNRKNYLEEKQLHLLHRREDRDIKIKTLENDISTCKFVMSTKDYDYTEEQRREYAEKLKLLEPEYKRIAAYSDEELLKNRELF
jgi:hypothetical protein